MLCLTLHGIRQTLLVATNPTLRNLLLGLVPVNLYCSAMLFMVVLALIMLINHLMGRSLTVLSARAILVMHSDHIPQIIMIMVYIRALNDM